MSSPLDAFQSEKVPDPEGPGAPDDQTLATPYRIVGATRAASGAGVAWRDQPVPRPAPGTHGGMTVVATSAITSATVTAVMLWLLGQGQTPWADAVAGAPDPQVPSEAYVETARPLVQEAWILTAPPSERPVPPPTRSETSPVAQSRPAPSGPSGLVVITEPDGARVTINGVGWGSTPLTIQHLAPGAKRVRVTKAGYRSEERIVNEDTVRSRATVRISLREAPDAHTPP
jgi:hypothetical protein